MSKEAKRICAPEPGVRLLKFKEFCERIRCKETKGRELIAQRIVASVKIAGILLIPETEIDRLTALNYRPAIDANEESESLVKGSSAIHQQAKRKRA